MSYSSASDVAGYCPGLTDSSGSFTATSRPPVSAVERFLSSGCALIEASLGAAGYSTPVPASATVYDYVVDLEAVYGAARAETARRVGRISADERTRARMFMDEFKAGLKALVAMRLDQAGVDVSATGKLYAGGISRDDKKTVREDSDRVRPAFKRGLLRFSGTVLSSDTDDGDWRRAE